jgi:hypothetical protein
MAEQGCGTVMHRTMTKKGLHNTLNTLFVLFVATIKIPFSFAGIGSSSNVFTQVWDKENILA